MIFYEKLTPMRLLHRLIVRQNVFYGAKSIVTVYVERLLAIFGLTSNARKLDFGNVDSAPDIRGNAYRAAELSLEYIRGECWAVHLSNVLKIDFWTVVKKVFFDELYLKFEFFEIALRYTREHPNEQHVIHVEKDFLDQYRERLEERFELHVDANGDSVGFLGIFLIPLFLKYFAQRHGIIHGVRFDNEMICELDSERSLQMFNALFPDNISKKFVMQKRSEQDFSQVNLTKFKFSHLGLTVDGYRFLARCSWQYILACLKFWKEIKGYGSRLFNIFYALVRGKAEAIDGSGNRYFVYEHLVTEKFVRNEFLKSQGNTSIFIPMNAHVTPQYFHSEIFLNYDVMCCAGKHVEDLYRKKSSLTQRFLPTGSFDSHQELCKGDAKDTRIRRLMAFKGDAVSVTILCPGICDPTYSQEVKLVNLARELAAQLDVKVFIRMKPVAPIAKYADFYESRTADCESILLTAGEYELSDFLDVTDLFITSISNSGFDLSLRGGQVMFVDYMKDPELSIVWSMIKEVVLPEHKAFEFARDWINDSAEGPERAQLRVHMHKLAAYLGYRFANFDLYRDNLLSQLHGELGNHPALQVPSRNRDVLATFV